MKNKIKLITLLSILFAGCLVGLQAFQNEKSEKNLFEKFKKQSAVDVRTFSKKLLKETDNNSSSSIKSSSLSQNKLGSLQKKNNSKVGGGVAKQNHFQDPFSGDPNDYIPVIPLESQTDAPDSTKKQFLKRSEKMREQGYIEADEYSVLKLPGEAISIQHLGSKSFMAMNKPQVIS